MYIGMFHRQETGYRHLEKVFNLSLKEFEHLKNSVCFDTIEFEEITEEKFFANKLKLRNLE